MTRLTIIAGAAALALSLAGFARAEGASFQLVSADFAGAPASGATVAPRSTLEWDAKKARWGLKLGVEQHTGDVQLRDVAPGVYYRLTPRLHIGGAVSLAPDQVNSPGQKLGDPQMPAPRVRLETTFKF